MTTQYCAIVSDNIKPEILTKIQAQCAKVFTASEVAELEAEQYGVLLEYIEAQKAARVEMPMRPIKQFALEVQGAQAQPDGTVKTLVVLNMAILFNLSTMRTDLETGETTEAMNAYARATMFVAPSYKSGALNSLFGPVSKYAGEIAKNPAAKFSANGGLDLNGTAGKGLNQQRVVFNAENSYAIFSINSSEIEIGSGTSYQLANLDIRNSVLMSKTGSSNVIEQAEFNFDDIIEIETTPASTPMVIPGPSNERRVPQVAASAPKSPVATARRTSTFPLG